MTDETAFSLRWPQPGDPVAPVAGQRPAQPRRRRRRIVYWVTFGLLWAAAAGLLAGAFAVLGFARASSPTMADTVQAGDLLAYQRGADGIVRGDMVMVQVPGVDGLLVRRVIGLPGDRVTCCDGAGRVTVDGKALAEDYLAQGTAPSLVTFAVTVSPGQAWVMGDNRGLAVDSREGDRWRSATSRAVSSRYSDPGAAPRYGRPRTSRRTGSHRTVTVSPSRS